jgi:signal recognition particle subunit SRP68
LLLLEAERAWGYAQELYKASLQSKNASHAGTLRHSATGRFRRAVNWSTQLLLHCQTLYTSDRFSAENLIQVTVYTLILNGRFLRYRDEFEDALPLLSVARNLLDELAASATTSRDQALAIMFSDEIGPEIRHCAHELGRQKAYDIDGIVAEIAPAHQGRLVEGFDSLVAKLRSDSKASAQDASRKRLQAILWEGQPVSIRNPELVDVLLKVQEAEAKLSARDQPLPGESVTDKKKRTKKENRTKKGVSAYDAILLALSDAEEVARKLKEAEQVPFGILPYLIQG